MGFKESIYNVKVRIDGEYYIYNTMFGSCLTYRLFMKLKKTDMPSLIRIHMLVPSDLDEYAMVRVAYYKGTYSALEQSFFIAPNLTCDFTCPYCYAPHTKAMMNSAVADEVADFIIGVSKSAENISLSWVGGEPLLNLERIYQICEKLAPMLMEKRVLSSVVTNGYYLTNLVCDTLANCGINTIVITVDGSAEIHNKRRVRKDGKPTFDKIMENIFYAVKKDIDIVLRMNVDYDNVSYIYPLIEYLKADGLLDKVHLSLVPVKQFDASNSYTMQLKNVKVIEKAITEATSGRVKWGGQNPILHCCSGAKVYDFSIGPGGELYACPIGIGKMDYVVGNITETLPTSEYYSWYSYDETTSNERCKNCSYFPLCLSDCRWINRNVFQHRDSCSSIIENYKEKIRNYVIRSKNERSTH